MTSLSGRKDEATRRPDGSTVARPIAGVIVRERPTVITRNGVTSEIFSAAWSLPTNAPQHAIHVSLKPGAISAWHRHVHQTDHIAVIEGMVKLVIYDPREDSPTHGRIDVHHLGPQRASLVVIPPGLWHGLSNMLSHQFSSFFNLFDRPYRHDDPDEWRLPHDTPLIPYRFDAA